MEINYTREKITSALFCLATEDKPLRERVADAHALLLRTSCHDGFEQDFARIADCLKSVKQGDYSEVSDRELAAVALTILEMNNRVCAT
jgi:hypothetical protein